VFSLLSLISQALLSFPRNLSNSDPKILENNYFPPSWHSSVLFLRLFYGVSSTLHLIPDLCTLCKRSYTIFEFLRWLCIPCDSLFTLPAKKTYIVPPELTSRDRLVQCTPCVLCAHLALAHEEKRFKFYAGISKIYTPVTRFMYY
jgi:hypothetical protein